MEMVYDDDSNDSRFCLKLTILSATNLMKKSFFSHPDPLAKISIDGSGYICSTDVKKATLNPKWNQHFELMLNVKDSITITVWNQKKLYKSYASGFLGCVKLSATAIQRIKDSGAHRLELNVAPGSTCSKKKKKSSVRGWISLSVSLVEKHAPPPPPPPQSSSSINFNTHHHYSSNNNNNNNNSNNNNNNDNSNNNNNNRLAYQNVVNKHSNVHNLIENLTQVTISRGAAASTVAATNTNIYENADYNLKHKSELKLKKNNKKNKAQLISAAVNEAGMNVLRRANGFALEASADHALGQRVGGYNSTAATYSTEVNNTDRCNSNIIVHHNNVDNIYNNITIPFNIDLTPRRLSDDLTTATTNNNATTFTGQTVNEDNGRFVNTPLIPSAPPLCSFVADHLSNLPTYNIQPTTKLHNFQTNCVSNYTNKNVNNNFSLNSKHDNSSDANLLLPTRTISTSMTPSATAPRPLTKNALNKTFVISSEALDPPSKFNNEAVSAREDVDATDEEMFFPVLDPKKFICSLPMPPDYQERVSRQGQIYYVHLPSGTSTWYHPTMPRSSNDEPCPDLLKAIENLPLSSVWEVRFTSTGRKYFVDHANKTTQFTDPRFFAYINDQQMNSKSDHNSHVSTRHDLKSKQLPLIFQNLQRNHFLPQQATSNQPLTVKYNSKRTVKSNSKTQKPSATTGNKFDPAATNETTAAVPPTVTTSLLLSQISLEMLEEKMSKLNEELLKLKAPTGHCRLEINRNNIFTESFRQIMRKRAADCYKRLLVKFKGEEGIDYGGIAREWLSLLSKEMFNPAFGLFQYTRDNQLYINPDSHVNSSHLYYFKFVGRIMALCVLHGHQIDADFTLPFYKQMLRQEVTLDDLRFVDVQLYNSLVWFRTNDITDVIESTFTVNHNSFGEVHVHELKTGGSNIPVTEDNKLEYIDLYVKWRLTVGCESQMRAFLKGFNELIPIQLISEFTPQELHMMLGGLNYVDVSDWKKYTKLKHCTVDSNIVRWFWTYVDQLTTEKRQALLKFVLGSHRIPVQGFKALQGSQGPRLFTIHQVNISTNNLPRAHTCFNRIDIPAYESYDIFLEKMNCAIEETEGFNFE